MNKLQPSHYDLRLATEYYSVNPKVELWDTVNISKKSEPEKRCFRYFTDPDSL